MRNVLMCEMLLQCSCGVSAGVLMSSSPGTTETRPNEKMQVFLKICFCLCVPSVLIKILLHMAATINCYIFLKTISSS